MVLKTRTDSSIISELYFDGEFQCYILEGVKTAIPAGRYEVRLTHSPKFDRTMPILCDVPGHQGIRIHPGNTAKDTEGCLLPGRVIANDNMIRNSVEAYESLFARLEKSPGPRWITISRTNAICL